MLLDYSGQNLQGRSFKGQDLEGANFSKADIRGANFKHTNLKGVNFTGATAGRQRSWLIGLLIAVFFMSAILGFVSILTSVLISDRLMELLTSSLSYPFGFIIVDIVFLVILTVCCVISIRKSFIVFAGTVATVIAIAITVVFPIYFFIDNDFGQFFRLAAVSGYTFSYTGAIGFRGRQASSKQYRDRVLKVIPPQKIA